LRHSVDLQSTQSHRLMSTVTGWPRHWLASWHWRTCHSSFVPSSKNF